MTQKGFSLVEMAVVCAIISVLAISVGPSLGGVKNSLALHEETRLLVTNLQNAKVEAIRGNSLVAFQLRADGYMIFVDSGVASQYRGDWVRQPEERLLVDHTFQDGVQLADTTFTVNRTQFNGRVGMKAGRVILSNLHGAKSQVVVSQMGRIRVEKE
jgi:prepilin-type N-terminal cleavage/methylation domain-containing protein